MSQEPRLTQYELIELLTEWLKSYRDHVVEKHSDEIEEFDEVVAMGENFRLPEDQR